MMQFTEDQRKALIYFINSELSGWDCEGKYHQVLQIALASLTVEPVGYIHNFLNSEQSGVIFAKENRHYGRGVYTTPPATAIRLPDELIDCLKELHDAFTDESHDDGYYSANIYQTVLLKARKTLSETKRLNATAPKPVPDGFVMVPRALTAENGAKAALLGEFNLEYNLVCHECFGEGCDDCSGEGSRTNSIPVDWTTIKEIWAKGVEHFQAAAPEVE